MAKHHTFVQVRLPAENLVLGSVTQREGQAQAVVESVVRKTQDPAFRVWSHVKGLDAAAVQALSTQIEERYSVSPRLSKTDSGHHVVYDVHPRHVKDAFWGALLAFQTSFGPPWLHFSGGHVTFRAQAVDCEPPECAARLQRALDLAETKASVEVVHLPDAELEELRKLYELRENALAENRDPPGAVSKPKQLRRESKAPR